jgi:FG-GAP repeat protein
MLANRVNGIGAIVGSFFLAGSPLPAQTALLHINGSNAGEAYGEQLEQVAIGFKFAPNYLEMVGVPDDSAIGPNAGRIDVRFATTGELAYSDYGLAAGDHFGISVAKGDVNGDGRPDYVMIGGDQRGNGGPGYVEFVDPLTGVSLVHVDGPVANSGFGTSITMLEDFDGDGVNDFAVGAPFEDNGALSEAGAVHIMSGNLFVELAVLRGATAGAHFGAIVHEAGDVDGNSVQDFAVGAPGDGGTGSVTVFGETLPPTQTWQALGAAANEDFGSSLELVTDVDGDARPDLLVAAPAFDDPLQAGRVALLSGATGTQITDVGGTNPGDLFGNSIQVGDFDGDAVRDVYVGAPNTDGAGVGRGAVEVYALTSPGVLTHKATLSGNADGDAFGTAIAVLPIAPKPIVGDYLAVGVPGFDGGGLDRGQVVVFSTTDSPASDQNYGAGWPGTLGIPNLSVNAPPEFQSIITFTIDNSAGIPTSAILFLGFVRANIHTHAGGTILCSPPWILQPLALPVGQLLLPSPVPTDVRYCGLTFDLQCLELDFGASRHISFTPGLEMVMGG